MLLSKKCCCSSNETRETSSSKLEDDEKRIVSQANENQMEFGLLKIKSELSGKKNDKAMKNLSSLGMTVIVGETKACR
jgi:lysyl-tRNA synthetase class 2